MATTRDAALAILLVAGCTGTYQPIHDPDRIPDDDDQQMTEARRAFEENVVPILAAKCDDCHSGGAGAESPKFLGQGEDAFYEEIVKYPSVTGDFNAGLAGILTKIASGDHYGLRYTDEEQQAIIDWLAAEALERGDGDDDGDIDQLPAVDALAEWSGCMTLDDWAVTNMGRWSEKETTEDGPCRTCHDDGLARFYASPDPTGMFAMQRYELYVIGFFTVKVDPDGTQTVVPALGKLRRMGRGAFHPNYLTDEDGDADFASLAEFHQLTSNRKANGQCGPAEFPEAPEI